MKIVFIIFILPLYLQTRKLQTKEILFTGNKTKPHTQNQNNSRSVEIFKSFFLLVQSTEHADTTTSMLFCIAKFIVLLRVFLSVAEAIGYYAVPEKKSISTPGKVIRNSRGRGVLKAKMLEAKNEADACSKEI